jgi:shikimate kinase
VSDSGHGDLGSRHLVLVGLMGVGKTTVGELLAARLDRPFVDSDFRIEALTGRTVRDIMTTDGVDEMRRLEAEALFDALADEEPSVIAAAAGVVLDTGHRRRLEASGAEVVWLTADTDTLAPRTASRGHRPFLETDPVGTLQRMYDERAPLYREVADHVVVVDELTPDEIADRILA